MNAMKAAYVLKKITGVSRRHLSNLVKQGKFRVVVKPSGQYNYNSDDVYQYIGKTSQNLNIIYARVSTQKPKADLRRQIEMLENFCSAKGINVDQVFSDVASGINARKNKTVFDFIKIGD
jgi:putative resolvase